MSAAGYSERDPLQEPSRRESSAADRLVEQASLSLAPSARRLVRRFLRRHGASPLLGEAAAICVTEAVANAVLHGYRERENPGIVEVSVSRPSVEAFVVVVRDYGTGMTPHPGSGGASLGLPLIAILADEVTVCGGIGEGTELRMSFAASRA